MGSVLERFFAKYVSINSFTEMVLRTMQRGEIMSMASEDRKTPDVVSYFAAVERHPYDFDFLATLRRLECIFANFRGTAPGRAQPTKRCG